MSDSSSSIIRATAKYHEANEPSKHKTMIRIDGTTTTHYIDAVDLANTIRASIDSGRDNPFRPDGEIYRSVDPIVDYYKSGPNQSRAQSPTYNQLIQANGKSQLMAEANGKKKYRKLGKKEKQQVKREKNNQKLHSDADGVLTEDGNTSKKKPFWRRWFCCCCYCCCDFKCCRKKEEKITSIDVDTGQQHLRTNLEIGMASSGGGDDDNTKLTGTASLPTSARPKVNYTSTQSTKSSILPGGGGKTISPVQQGQNSKMTNGSAKTANIYKSSPDDENSMEIVDFIA